MMLAGESIDRLLPPYLLRSTGIYQKASTPANVIQATTA